MTTEEAIRVLEDRECCHECVHTAFGIDGCKDGCDECDKAFEMAIAALRAQQQNINQYPCNSCNIGYCSVSANGVTSSCTESCEKLAAYRAMVQQEAEKKSR